MVIPGHIENGVVVFDGDVSLPEGAEVTVVVQSIGDKHEVMTKEQYKIYVDALSCIDSIPDENPGDSFGGADHDKVLYGEWK